jgi:acetyl-CoA synthetase
MDLSEKKSYGAASHSSRARWRLEMSEKVYDVPAAWRQRAYIDDAKYREMYARSVDDPNGFWAEHAKRLHWYRAPMRIKNTSYDPHNVSIKWFEDGTLNAAYNCIDRNLATRGNQTALIWEGDDPKDDKKITYKQLHEEVCKFANVLKARGVKKGDRVTIYLPMIPEAAYAMLACARIGAVHSVVFGGFSPDSLAGRISDCQSTVVVTADEGVRGGKKIPLKANTDAACDKAGNVNSVIVVRRTGANVEMKPRRDVYYDELVKTVEADCPCEEMNAEETGSLSAASAVNQANGRSSSSRHCARSVVLPKPGGAAKRTSEAGEPSSCALRRGRTIISGEGENPRSFVSRRPTPLPP